MGFKMKYSIKKQYLTSGTSRRPGIKMPYVGFMVAHDTGNPGSTASGNVGYYERSRNEQSASAHIFVDDKEIIECIPLLTATPEKAWHVIYNVTTDNRMYGDDADDIAGGVELCWGSGIDADEAYKRYVWVLAYACYKFKLDPAKKLTGHEVLDPARKIDPSNGLKHSNGKNLSSLIKDVIKEYNECLGKTTSKEEPAVSGSTYVIKDGDTLWEIAQRSGGAFTIDDLLKWNPSINPSALKVGSKINIKKPASKTAEKKPASKPATKKVTLPNVVLKKGSKGSDVLKVQEALCDVYFYPEKGAKNNGCDGIYGPNTENAVKRFQTVYCNPADGIYGPKTKAKLESLLNK